VFEEDSAFLEIILSIICKCGLKTAKIPYTIYMGKNDFGFAPPMGNV
jgi:hypothetical protein